MKQYTFLQEVFRIPKSIYDPHRFELFKKMNDRQLKIYAKKVKQFYHNCTVEMNECKRRYMDYKCNISNPYYKSVHEFVNGQFVYKGRVKASDYYKKLANKEALKFKELRSKKDKYKTLLDDVTKFMDPNGFSY